MLKVISWIVIGFVSNLFDCYCFLELTENKKFKVTKPMILFSFIFALINCYSVYYCSQFRLLVIFISSILLLEICYNKSIVTCAVVNLYETIIMSISEIIFVVIFCWIFRMDINFFSDNVIGMIITNFFIMLTAFLIIKNLTLKKFKIFIRNHTNKLKDLNTMIMVLLSVIIIAILVYPISQVQLPIDLYFIYVTIFLTGVTFITAFFNVKNKQNKVANEYDLLTKYVKVYEKLIDEKSKQQHENKNQLVIVRSMIHKNNKKAIDYIDKLLNIDLGKQDSDYINKLKSIPDGIKGLIYYKIEEMKNLGICVYLDVPNKIKKNTKILCEENLTDLSRILGVYLDNAKDAAYEADKKYVIIELKDEEEIKFIISNTYKNVVNLEKIDRPKFTSKGKGHGYGLSLVKDIIEKNEKFEQQREINGIYYVQSLNLKQKNSISK